MSKQITDEIAEKIRKILNLTVERGATQGEMEAAVGKAKEMAMRYGIDLASLNVGDGGPKQEWDVRNDDSLKIRTQYEQPFHRWIFNVLQDVFGTRFILSRGQGKNRSNVIFHKIWIIGETTDIVIVKALFPWLEQIYWDTFYEGAKKGLFEKNAAGRNGCYAGLSRGIKEANKNTEAAFTPEEQGKWAVVLVKKEDLIQRKMAADFPNLRNRQARSIDMDSNAYSHGYERGKQVNLSQSGSGSKPAGHLN